MRDLARVQVTLPGIEIVHAQGKMIAPMMRNHRVSAAADQMQLLRRPELEPGAGKTKRRARNGRQPQRLAVETRAPLDVGDMKRHMVQFKNLHAQGMATAVFSACDSSAAWNN